MAYSKYYSNGWQSGEAGGTPITPEALNHMEEGIAAALRSDGIVPVKAGGTGVNSLTKLLTALFPNTATPTYIPVFGSGWESAGYATPAALRSAMGFGTGNGVLGAAYGGTGVSSLAKLKTSLGFTSFNAYSLSSTTWVGVLSGNWGSISEGSFVIYADISGSKACYFGFKYTASYGAAICIEYGNDAHTLYRNYGGTWSEKVLYL